MAVVSGSAVRQSQLSSIKRVGLIAACVLAVVFLAVVIPFAQEARLTHQCAKLGGQLEQSTEDVEPLVTSRSVYRCLGPDGQVLQTW